MRGIEQSVTLNRKQVTCPPGETVHVRLRRRVDPARREFFARDFLDEPETDWRGGPLPY